LLALSAAVTPVKLHAELFGLDPERFLYEGASPPV
jgi:hypothetical protein